MDTRYLSSRLNHSRTNPGIGPGGWNRHALAQSQIDHAAGLRARADVETERNSRYSGQTTFKVYTERKANVPTLVAVWFDGATIYETLGLWKGTAELSCVVEIVAPLSSLARVISMARDIRVTNAQSSVLIAWRTSAGLQAFDVRD